METGEQSVFDGSALYAHNEYELGNWRGLRHRLGSKTYIRNPGNRCLCRSLAVKLADNNIEDEWESQNLLYSLLFHRCAATLIPGSNYRGQYVEFPPKVVSMLIHRVEAFSEMLGSFVRESALMT